MATAGVLINPTAGRGNGKGLALAAALKAHPHVSVNLLAQFSDLLPALRRMAESGVDTVFISSGDGTVQAVQTFLAESGAFKTLPRICLLPHGTTNMTAADLGFRQKSITAQAGFIARPEPGEIRSRATVRVANPRDGVPRHGMFLATGAASEATRYAQVAFNDRGVKGSFATSATLAGAVGKCLFSKANAFDPNRFDRPFPITVRADGETLCSGMQLLALAGRQGNR